MQQLQGQDKGQKKRKKKKIDDCLFFSPSQYNYKPRLTASTTFTSMFTNAINKHSAYFHQLATEMSCLFLSHKVRSDPGLFNLKKDLHVHDNLT